MTRDGNHARDSVTQRALAWPLILTSLPAVILVSATTWVFWYVEGPAAGLGKGLMALLLFLPSVALLALGLATYAGTLSLSRDGGGIGLRTNLLYGGLAALLFTQALFLAAAYPALACGCSIRHPGAALKSDLKNLASQQEIHFSEYGTYTDDYAAMAFGGPSTGAAIELAVQHDGWAARVSHQAYPVEAGWSCAMFYGPGAVPLATAAGQLPGQPGEIICDDRMSRARHAIERIGLPGVAEDFVLWIYRKGS